MDISPRSSVESVSIGMTSYGDLINIPTVDPLTGLCSKEQFFIQAYDYDNKHPYEGVDAIEVLAGMWSSEAGKNTKPESAYPDCQATILAKIMKIMIFLQTGKKAKIHMIVK